MDKQELCCMQKKILKKVISFIMITMKVDLMNIPQKNLFENNKIKLNSLLIKFLFKFYFYFLIFFLLFLFYFYLFNKIMNITNYSSFIFMFKI